MQIIEQPQEWKTLRNNITAKTIGFVPTMGNLHQGHASLIQRSVQENDITVLSIFVNPTQFNNKEDLAKYPKTLEDDFQLSRTLNVDYILLPNYQQLYPDNYHYKIVEDSAYGQSLEGTHRPGHFSGMLTIVLKLLLLVSPTKAYFGEKDYQQYRLVSSMAEAFLLNCKIVACPTIRNDNGLPLSSRNRRLTEQQLSHAALFSKLLASNSDDKAIVEKLTDNGFIVDYIETHNNRRYGAVKLGGVRLIDNTEISS